MGFLSWIFGKASKCPQCGARVKAEYNFCPECKAPAVGAWLLCQAFSLTLNAASVCAGMTAPSVEQTCTCAHGDGQECPMHHTKSKSPASCSCRSTNEAPAALVSLFGTAILAQSESLPGGTVSSDLSVAPQTEPLGASVIPDPPPPRA